jgi:hypothetical protein
MDSLRHVAPTVSVVGAVALAMAAGKALGSTAIISGGAPGGAMTPTIVVGAGSAMLAVLAGNGLGWGTPDVWALTVLAGSAAIAVGLRAPLTAILLLPELTGRFAILPATAAVVLRRGRRPRPRPLCRPPCRTPPRRRPRRRRLRFGVQVPPDDGAAPRLRGFRRFGVQVPPRGTSPRRSGRS